jgi:ComF family protein
VHEAKFHGNKKAFMLLGGLLQMYLREQAPKVDVIIPLPLSSPRLRARGYNQVYEVLKTQEPEVLNKLDTTSLIRTRNTRPQTELEREARLLNMHNAFSVKNHEKIIGKHILVVDDVSTTGATLHSAKASLLPYNPASVTLIALAH